MAELGYYTDSLTDFESSFLHSLFYDEDEKILYVLFDRDGSLFGYTGVGPDIWRLFKTSPSKGAVYSQYVKGGYYRGIDSDYLRNITLKPRQSDPEDNVVSLFPGATTFVVRGTRPVEVEQTIVSQNLPEAISKFLEDNPDATVTEVTIKLV